MLTAEAFQEQSILQETAGNTGDLKYREKTTRDVKDKANYMRLQAQLLTDYRTTGYLKYIIEDCQRPVGTRETTGDCGNHQGLEKK